MNFKEEGNNHLKKQEYLKARVSYTKGIDLNPPDVHLLYSNRSVANLCMNDIGNASEDAERVIMLKPTWFKGYLRKSQVLMKKKEFQLAIEALAVGLQKIPQNKVLKTEFEKIMAIVRKQSRNSGHTVRKAFNSVRKDPFIEKLIVRAKNGDLKTIQKLAHAIDNVRQLAEGGMIPIFKKEFISGKVRDAIVPLQMITDYCREFRREVIIGDNCPKFVQKCCRELETSNGKMENFAIMAMFSEVVLDNECLYLIFENTNFFDIIEKVFTYKFTKKKFPDVYRDFMYRAISLFQHVLARPSKYMEVLKNRCLGFSEEFFGRFVDYLEDGFDGQYNPKGRKFVISVLNQIVDLRPNQWKQNLDSNGILKEETTKIFKVLLKDGRFAKALKSKDFDDSNWQFSPESLLLCALVVAYERNIPLKHAFSGACVRVAIRRLFRTAKKDSSMSHLILGMYTWSYKLMYRVRRIVGGIDGLKKLRCYDDDARKILQKLEIQMAFEDDDPRNFDKCIKCLVSGKKLMKCANCREARYCSRECQVADWKSHKRACKKIKKNRETPNGGIGEMHQTTRQRYYQNSVAQGYIYNYYPHIKKRMRERGLDEYSNTVIVFSLVGVPEIEVLSFEEFWKRRSEFKLAKAVKHHMKRNKQLIVVVNFAFDFSQMLPLHVGRFVFEDDVCVDKSTNSEVMKNYFF